MLKENNKGVRYRSQKDTGLLNWKIYTISTKFPISNNEVKKTLFNTQSNARSSFQEISKTTYGTSAEKYLYSFALIEKGGKKSIQAKSNRKLKTLTIIQMFICNLLCVNLLL